MLYPEFDHNRRSETYILRPDKTRGRCLAVFRRLSDDVYRMTCEPIDEDSPSYYELIIPSYEGVLKILNANIVPGPYYWNCEKRKPAVACGGEV